MPVSNNRWPPRSLLKSGFFSAGLSAEFLFLSMLPLEHNIPLPLSAGPSPFLSANFFDLLLPLGAPSLFDFLDAVTDFPTGKETVHLAGALGLALYFDPARVVLKVDARAGFVDFLSPVTCTSDKSLDKVILQNP